MRSRQAFWAVTFVAFVAASSVVLAVATVLVERTSPQRTARNTNAPSARSGDEIVAVLVITQTCAAARREDFKTSLRAGLHSLRDAVRSRGYSPYFVGAALSGNTGPGRRFIAEFGEFDEVVVGRGWLNSAAIHYVWRDFSGIATVPQLIIVHRRVTVSGDRISVSPDSLLLRLTGADEIIRWANAGGPLDL